MGLFGSKGLFGGISSALFGDGPAPPDTSGIAPNTCPLVPDVRANGPVGGPTSVKSPPM